MKALSLTQPWATLVAIGAKKIETRSWSTRRREQIAIHAAKGFPTWAKDECRSSIFARCLWPDAAPSRIVSDLIDSLPRGAIIAVADIVGCKATSSFMGGPHSWIAGLSEQERAFGDYSANRFGWLLENVTALAVPVPCRGALSLWDVPEDVEQQIREIEYIPDHEGYLA